jgi:hypothetical protein
LNHFRKHFALHVNFVHWKTLLQDEWVTFDNCHSPSFEIQDTPH